MNSSSIPGKPLNSIVEACPPSGIRRFFDIARQMEGVIALGVGEPDFVTPDVVRIAGIKAISDGLTGYTSNSGLLELRTAICNYLERAYGVQYSPDHECLITVGVSEGLDLALRVLVNPGDEIIVPSPCYVAYLPGIEFVGGVPVTVETAAETGFAIDPEAVERAITPRTKALLIASPANPTGAVQPAHVLQQLVNLAVKHDLYIISDEIYERLCYDSSTLCLGALEGARNRTVILNGFSKSHAMTGWRVGYCCGPEHIIALMTRIHQYTMLCAPHLSQVAATVAMNEADSAVQLMISDYRARRSVFVTGLNDLGLECKMPGGAFYAFPSIRSSGLSSQDFAEKLLFEEKVAVVPGDVFGPGGEGHIRCSYAASVASLKEALERLQGFLQRYRASGNSSL